MIEIELHEIKQEEIREITWKFTKRSKNSTENGIKGDKQKAILRGKGDSIETCTEVSITY